MFIPQDLTWTLTNFETGQALRRATGVHPLDIWFPQLKTLGRILSKLPETFILYANILNDIFVQGGSKLCSTEDLKYFIMLPRDVKPMSMSPG